MYPVYPYYSYRTECQTSPITFPPQQQDRQPGLEYLVIPRPISQNPGYRRANKLLNKVAVVTGGDSGIGRAVAIAFAKEGADVTIAYFDEHKDAVETQYLIRQWGRRCIAIPCDLREEKSSSDVIEQTIDTFGHIDIVVNNSAVQFPQMSILDVSEQQLEDTFRTNIYSYFFMTKAALPYLQAGSAIINTASVAAYEGIKELLAYSATKGAVVSFTRSLAMSLVKQGIRVNGVAPGPIWTPFISATFPVDRLITFGLNTPMKRAGQPFEVAPAYVYLASDDSSYMTGQILHVNGGGLNIEV
ncbi:SDR family oxidoreductase [Brevibacillus sp. SYSU BS000544]|uniref:SDR family oxidoreductase n=1 Tax=Brevibacillus sp. SYSU BS000544 TaxID=3416443 RepID=UPI003CE53FC4